MKEYNVVSPMGNELSIADYKEVTNVVEKKFSKDLIQEIGDKKDMVQEWYAGEESLFLVYGKENIKCLAESPFTKKWFESKTKLKLEEIN